MNESIAEMPFLKNVGFVVTYRCQVECPHCIIRAGPHRKTRMRLSDALQWIDQIATYRNGHIKVLSLTGGEPFYDMTLLGRISEYAAEKGLFVSAVTNAFWAVTPQEAIAVLRSVPAIGMLAISTDIYHQQSISFSRVKNAIQAVQHIGMPYNIAVCTENTNDSGYQRILADLYAVTKPETVVTAVTFPAGRAMEKIAELNYHLSDTPPISACAAGSSPIIFPSGKVLACIGPVIDLKNEHPLLLGDLRKNSLDEILNTAECNSVLHTIRVWGPKRLIELAGEAGLGKFLPQKYVEGSMCQACYMLMANHQIVGFLRELSRDDAFVEKVAYARAYYLQEGEMAMLCHRGVRAKGVL